MTAASGMRVLDLFSAAAGGWSLGMHRAGFTTIAACEAVDWRRVLYAQNNPGVPIYEDVCTLTAERLLRDIGELPTVIVGSPPCQDISPANTKGKGVEGERSGLFFEAIRIIGECRPRWFALENSANLRTRGADAVLAELEAIDYACWAIVVRASDIGANHERPRSWIIGCDLGQVADADRNSIRLTELPERPVEEAAQSEYADLHPARFGHEGWRTRRHGADGVCAASTVRCNAADAAQVRHAARAGDDEGARREGDGHELPDHTSRVESRKTPDPDQAGRDKGRETSWTEHMGATSWPPPNGASSSGNDGRSTEARDVGQMAVCAGDSGDPDRTWPLWSLDDLAGRLRMDDGLPARLAGTRVAVGGPRGTSAASLIVEAYGDAVVPQIPEAIGRAFLRVERAMAALAQPARAEEG